MMLQSLSQIFSDTLRSIKNLIRSDMAIKSPEDLEYQQRAVVMNFTIVLSIVVAIIWFVFEITFRQRLIPLIAQIFGIIGGSFFLWWQKKSSLHDSATVFVALFCSILIMLTLFLQLSNPTIFWLFLIPPVSFFIGGERNGIVWSCIVVVLFSFLSLFAYLGLVGNPTTLIFIIDFLTSFIIVVVFTFFYERTRHNVQTSLRATVHRDQTVLDTIQDGIIVIDQEMHIRMFSRGAERILGWSQDEVLDTKLEAYITLDLTQDISKLHTSITKEAVELKNKNQETIYTNLIISPIVLSPEHIEGNAHFIITVQDVTQASELVRMKLDFVSMAAHELRTPLTSIIGYLSVFMKNDAWMSLTDDDKLLLERVKLSADQLSALMENLLMVSKIEGGSKTLNLQTTNWVTLLRERVDELKHLAGTKGLTLTFYTPSEDIFVNVDPMRIAEVINNLVSNAVKYTDKGGIRITTGIDLKNHTVYTSCTDTGHGIAKKAIPHMFEKFYKVNSSLEQGTTGTGLGLFISKSIVELHGGTISISSDGEEKGSTVTFTLPLDTKT